MEWSYDFVKKLVKRGFEGTVVTELQKATKWDTLGVQTEHS